MLVEFSTVWRKPECPVVFGNNWYDFSPLEFVDFGANKLLRPGSVSPVGETGASCNKIN